MISLRQLDEIAHDPLQTHLPEFAGGRGPYPGHPAESNPEEPATPDANPGGETVETGLSITYGSGEVVSV